MNKFLQANAVVVISHANPDCDAIGSLLGVYWTLLHAGCNVCAVNVGPLPKRLDFLPGFEKINNIMPVNTDILIALDCGSFARLGIEKLKCEIINIDHHLSNDYYGNINIIDAMAPSASIVAFEFLCKLGFAVPKEAAICFYAALLADSGRFCYDTVNHKTFDIASKLITIGASAGDIGMALTQRRSIAQLKLQAKVFNGIKLYKNDSVAFINVSTDDFRCTNASIADADGFADKARSLDGVILGVCLREQENGQIRVSLRSKLDLDASKIAKHWGGGGHYSASGFEVDIINNFEYDSSKIQKQILELI